MATQKQESARRRNFTKRRLMGISIDESTLTDWEGSIYSEIKAKVSLLINNWDRNTEEKLNVKLKPYKCHWCGKRSNKKHEVSFDKLNKLNYCLKHFKITSKEISDDGVNSRGL